MNTQRMYYSGCSTPVISEKWVKKYNVKLHLREIPIAIQNFNGEVVTEEGSPYTYPITFRYEGHYTDVSLEVAPMDDDCDGTLPSWWIETQLPSNFIGADGPVRFESVYCRTNFTAGNVTRIEIEHDD